MVKKKRKPSKWNAHVMATKKKNPKMKLGEAMKAASKTYKKA